MNKTLRRLFKKDDGETSPTDRRTKKDDEESEGEESESEEAKKRGSKEERTKSGRPASMIERSGSGSPQDWKFHFQDKLRQTNQKEEPLKKKKTKTSRGRPKSLTNNQVAQLSARKKKRMAKMEKEKQKDDGMFASPSTNIGGWDGYEIHGVCYRGDIRRLFELVKLNRDLNSPNGDANTPLHFSCALGKTMCVKELLKHPDVDTQFPNRSGEPPLHIASREGHLDIVELMVKNGRCKMFEKDRMGKTAIEIAKNDDVKKAFLKQQMREEKFLYYAHERNFEKVVKYLNLGVNVNCTRDHDGKKRNALGILFDTKKLSSLDKHADLIRLLVNRGCEVSKEAMAFDSSFSELLNEGYLRGKRYNFLREILQTEKVYNDDLWITVNLFWYPIKQGGRGKEKSRRIFTGIKKEEYKRHLKKFWNTYEDIRRVALKNSERLRVAFENYSNLLGRTEGAAHPNRSEELAEAEQQYVACLQDVDLDPYIKFCYQQTYMEGWIRKKRELSEVFKFYKKQEQNIPLPRIRDGGFVSMLSKVRNRLFKYRGFLECLLKYTDSGRNDDYIEILNQALKHIMEGLDRINQDAGEVENKKQMLQIHNLFKERYNIKMLIQNKDRKYICHETNFLAFNMESLETHLCDIYVFSDSVFFGSKRKGEGFEFYWYNKNKMIWIWHDDHYRMIIYKTRDEGGEKILDYIVPATYGYTWFKEMKEFFRNYQRTFYYNHIFLHAGFSMDKEIEEFRLKRVDDDEMKTYRRMMMKYKNRQREAEERSTKYMNKVIEMKKVIEKEKRKMKKVENLIKKLKMEVNKEIIEKGKEKKQKEDDDDDDDEEEGEDEDEKEKSPKKPKTMRLPAIKMMKHEIKDRQKEEKIKKIDLKVKFSMEPGVKQKGGEGTKKTHVKKVKRKIVMNVPEDETPIKVPYNVNQNIFDSFGGGDEEEEGEEDEEGNIDSMMFNGLFSENPFALRLFTTPTEPEEQ